jgi:hypothetical protein
MKVSKVLIFCAVMAALGLGRPRAQADTWQLTQSNVALGVSGDFVSVTISVTGDTATFTVIANTSLLNAGSNFGIDRFGFNTAICDITPVEISLQSGWSVRTNRNESSCGTFDFEYKGAGNSRAQPLVFSITDPDIASASQFYEANASGYSFVAEVAGFSPLNGQTSAFFADNPDHPVKVSEPSGIFLLSSGLAGLAVFKKTGTKDEVNRKNSSTPELRA